MNSAEHFEVLCNLLRPDVEGSAIAASEKEWDAIVKLGIAHGVGTILLQRLKDRRQLEVVPATARQQLIAERHRVAIENTKLYCELGAILEAFHRHRIGVVVLKGAYLAEITYADISLRPMDDIDLLVKETDLQMASRILSELGYAQSESDAERMKSNSPHHLVPFRKEGCKPIEIHWTLPSMEQRWVATMWSRARPVVIAGVAAVELLPAQLLIQLSVHTALHHRFGVGLRPLCDIATVVLHFRDELDSESLLRTLQEWKLQTVVYVALRVAKETVGASVPEHLLEHIRPNAFDPRLIAWAGNQLRTRSNEISDSSSVSPRLAQLWASGSLATKFSQLLRAAFPPPDTLRRNMYSRTYLPLLYLHHWKHLLQSRGGVIWRLLIRDKNVISKQALYAKLTQC